MKSNLVAIAGLMAMLALATTARAGHNAGAALIIHTTAVSKTIS